MEKYFSISKMAEMHNVSRQTLIHYDKIGLFEPEYIDDHGYRFYSPFQIPFLREICFLKSIGIKLEDIKEHINNRNLNSAISLLEYHREFIDKEISKQLTTRRFIQERLNIYTNADRYKEKLNIPIIQEFPARKVVFFPFENEVCKQELHLTLMKSWNILIKHGILPSYGFGVIIMKNGLEKNNVFEGAGVYTSLPVIDFEIENVITLPAGQYVCMSKYGMPYDSQFLYRLLEWIKESGYNIIGNVVDACLLDTTFYAEHCNVDLCQLQIPVEKTL